MHAYVAVNEMNIYQPPRYTSTWWWTHGLARASPSRRVGSFAQAILDNDLESAARKMNHDLLRYT